MAFSHTITRQVNNGGETIAKTNTYSGDGRESRTIAVPDSTTDQLVNLTMDVSQIKSLYIVSNYAVTVETNSSSAPTNTIALVADTPLIWHTGSYYTNLLTADVTAIYLTNASGSAATVNIEIVHDSTP